MKKKSIKKYYFSFPLKSLLFTNYLTAVTNGLRLEVGERRQGFRDFSQDTTEAGPQRRDDVGAGRVEAHFGGDNYESPNVEHAGGRAAGSGSLREQ